MTVWKPPQQIRALALGLAWRGDALLATRVVEHTGQFKGVRPLGGAIDFLEPARDALIREFREELGAAIDVTGPPAAFENIYEYNGARGHEVIFAHPIRLLDSALYAKDRIPIIDTADAAAAAEWFELAALGPGKIELFPRGLLEAIHAARAASK